MNGQIADISRGEPHPSYVVYLIASLQIYLAQICGTSVCTFWDQVCSVIEFA